MLHVLPAGCGELLVVDSCVIVGVFGDIAYFYIVINAGSRYRADIFLRSQSTSTTNKLFSLIILYIIYSRSAALPARPSITSRRASLRATPSSNPAALSAATSPSSAPLSTPRSWMPTRRLPRAVTSRTTGRVHSVRVRPAGLGNFRVCCSWV